MNDDTIRKEDIFVTEPKASLLLFYQYTRNGKWTQNQLKLLMTYLSNIAKKRHIGGRIRVSQEGVNATISAVDLNGISARETLRFIAKDLQNFDSNVFTTETDFKYIDNLKPDRHFKELKIIPVQELVFYGFKDEEAPLNKRGGTHLDAQKYHEMLKKENTVVIDVRNHYETVIGRFDGQDKKNNGGAEYLDPKMRKSTDFKSWLETPETQQKLENKTVL
jgi:predicted sulfurtransferase